MSCPLVRPHSSYLQSESETRLATPAYEDEWLQVWLGDCRAMMREMPEESVHLVVTSPPYWSLRAYGTEPQVWGGDPAHEHEWSGPQRSKAKTGGTGASTLGAASGGHGISDDGIERSQKRQAHEGTESASCGCGAWLGELGQEPSPDRYVANLVDVFREVRRVLRPDGLVFLNIGDTYAAERGGTPMPAETFAGGIGGHGDEASHRGRGQGPAAHRKASAYGLKHKDLCLIPSRVALALQEDGWWVRNDIIWALPNPMPESVRDRLTSSYEHVFMLAKSARYYFDQDAVREPHTDTTLNRVKYGLHHRHPDGIGVGIPPVSTDKMGDRFANPAGRNRRDFWLIPSKSYTGAHYAVMPEKLVEPCIRAGTSEKGVCPTCGAPWTRVTERIREERGDAFGTKDIGEFDHGQAGSPYQQLVAIETIGWLATCEHGADPELRECPECGAAYVEVDAIDPWEQFTDRTREQSIRAVEIAKSKGLTVAHIVALRASGITDTGKATVTQNGTGRNTEDVQRLASEAKEALGGYTREFTFLPPKTLGWVPSCEHGVPDNAPAVVLDPFGGSGTVAKVAQSLSRRAILIDLKAEYMDQQMTRNAQMPLGLGVESVL